MLRNRMAHADSTKLEFAQIDQIFAENEPGKVGDPDLCDNKVDGGQLESAPAVPKSLSHCKPTAQLAH